MGVSRPGGAPCFMPSLCTMHSSSRSMITIHTVEAEEQMTRREAEVQEGTVLQVGNEGALVASWQHARDLGKTSSIATVACPLSAGTAEQLALRTYSSCYCRANNPSFGMARRKRHPLSRAREYTWLWRLGRFGGSRSTWARCSPALFRIQVPSGWRQDPSLFCL